MDSYIVRVYRYNPSAEFSDEEQMVGTVQAVETDTATPFASMEELWRVIEQEQAKSLEFG